MVGVPHRPLLPSYMECHGRSSPSSSPTLTAHCLLVPRVPDELRRNFIQALGIPDDLRHTFINRGELDMAVLSTDGAVAEVAPPYELPHLQENAPPYGCATVGSYLTCTNYLTCKKTHPRLPHLQENAPPCEPTVTLCLGPYVGPIGGGIFLCPRYPRWRRGGRIASSRPLSPRRCATESMSRPTTSSWRLQRTLRYQQLVVTSLGAWGAFRGGGGDAAPAVRGPLPQGPGPYIYI